mgnify:CR=1 FL=1
MKLQTNVPNALINVWEQLRSRFSLFILHSPFYTIGHARTRWQYRNSLCLVVKKRLSLSLLRLQTAFGQKRCRVTMSRRACLRRPLWTFPLSLSLSALRWLSAMCKHIGGVVTRGVTSRRETPPLVAFVRSETRRRREERGVGGRSNGKFHRETFVRGATQSEISAAFVESTTDSIVSTWFILAASVYPSVHPALSISLVIQGCNSGVINSWNCSSSARVTKSEQERERERQTETDGERWNSDRVHVLRWA